MSDPSLQARKVHEIAACGVLRDLHDELDRLVADAYGWPWPMETEEILARLVALHDERVDEERRGLVRWLRPDYQVPRFGDKVEGDLALDDTSAAPEDDTPAANPDWPSDPIAQLTALREAVADRPRTLEQAARRFKGAKRADVAKHLEALEVLGVVTRVEDGKWQARGGAAVGAFIIGESRVREGRLSGRPPECLFRDKRVSRHARRVTLAKGDGHATCQLPGLR